MGLFSRLFGGKSENQIEVVQPVEYKGFLIYQEPLAEGGQYRIAGRITKEVDGELKPTALFVPMYCQVKKMPKN